MAKFDPVTRGGRTAAGADLGLRRGVLASIGDPMGRRGFRTNKRRREDGGTRPRASRLVVRQDGRRRLHGPSRAINRTKAQT